MFSVLYAVLCLTSARHVRADTGVRSREFYMSGYFSSYIPPNDAEVWIGWRRIYTGENVFTEMADWKFSIKFRAPSDRLSTAIVRGSSTDASCFHWVRINIPGGDATRGDDLRPISALPGQAEGLRSTTRIVLVFPQKEKLDLKTASNALAAMQKCSISSFESDFHLERPDAVCIYSLYPSKCGPVVYRVSNESSPDWNYLKENLNRIANSQLFSKTPREVIEVEYSEGVSVRMGNCLPTFLTASAPASVKFSVATSSYYTLCFIEYTSPFSCEWLVVNVADGDLRKGEEVVPYSAFTRTGGSTNYPAVFLLFSQGKNRIAVSEIKKLSDVTPNDLTEKVGLEDPVAANFFTAYWTTGVPPAGHPSIPSSRPLSTSPLSSWSSTQRVSQTTRMAIVPTTLPPTTPGSTSIQVSRTTRMAIVPTTLPPTTPGSTSIQVSQTTGRAIVPTTLPPTTPGSTSIQVSQTTRMAIVPTSVPPTTPGSTSIQVSQTTGRAIVSTAFPPTAPGSSSIQVKGHAYVTVVGSLLRFFWRY